MVDLDLDLNISGLTSARPSILQRLDAKSTAETADSQPVKKERTKGKGKGKGQSKGKPEAAEESQGRRAKTGKTEAAQPVAAKKRREPPAKKEFSVKALGASSSVASNSAEATLELNADGPRKKKLRRAWTESGEGAQASKVRPLPASAGIAPAATLQSETKTKKGKKRPRAESSDKQQDGKADGATLDTPFEKLGLNDTLTRQLTYLNFHKCTPIQAVSVPAALGKARPDVLLRASTGSGKTLAFLLPVLHQMLESGLKREDGTLGVVLNPTKELAAQTLKVAMDLVRMRPYIVCGALAGGENPKSEKARLRKGLSLICATPGRLAYHLEHTATFKRDKLRYFVMDEVDRLLDMGFEPQVKKIYRFLRDGEEEQLHEGQSKKAKAATSLQTLLVSATLGIDVRRLADFCLRKGSYFADPEITDKTGDRPDEEETVEFVAPKRLTQWYVELQCKERLPALIASILSRAKGKKAIIFFSNNHSVDFHHDIFLEARWPTRGGAPQREKNAAPKKKLKKVGDFIGFKDNLHGGDDEDDSAFSDGSDAEDSEKQDAAEEGNSRSNLALGGKVFENMPLFKLHGDLTAEERAGYIDDFAKASHGALLASDAASRGLDFPQIDWIIQYDPPQRTEEYLHRVGRTARIGRAGNALMFLQPSELGFLDLLKAKGLHKLQRLEAQQLHSSLLSSGAPPEMAKAKDIPSLMLAVLKRCVEENEALTRLARSAFLASLQSYRAFSKELRECFDYQQLHVGHYAGSFGLRETPKEAARRDRKGTGKGKSGKASGKAGKSQSTPGRGGDDSGKGKSGGKAAGKSKQSGKSARSPATATNKGLQQRRYLPTASDEFL
eukprot:TRINITY_DN7595_c0_g1_i1.p1 TRINITY_DN7595_c0_g1~~TRINITY_DN7595_c0_g1_i1.p1  ORF type:complete len:843 (-),score=213.25 TRINITY_DN7595_c0_g1_i1:171-2699(-)